MKTYLEAAAMPGLTQRETERYLSLAVPFDPRIPQDGCRTQHGQRPLISAAACQAVAIMEIVCVVGAVTAAARTRRNNRSHRPA